MLQSEINSVQYEIDKLLQELDTVKKAVEKFSVLLTDRYEVSPLPYLEVLHLEKGYENIAGVEVPLFENVIFPDADYSLFDTPIWMDSLLYQMRLLIQIKEKWQVSEEKN